MKPTPVIFILSRGHSGSTLLDMLLNAHSQLVGLGECEKASDKFHNGEACACGQTLPQCPFWSDLALPPEYITARIRKVHRGKWATLLGREQFWLRQFGPGTITLEAYQYEQERFFAYAQERAGATYVVDATKNPDRVAFLLRSGQIEPHVIHLVRDGRGVLYSYIKKFGFRLSHITEWVTYNLKVAWLVRRLPVRYHFVHYDQLVSEPAETLQALLAELDLDYEPAMLEPSSASHHQIGGNAAVYERPVIIKADLSWREHLSATERVWFLLLAGWLNWWYRRKT